PPERTRPNARSRTHAPERTRPNARARTHTRGPEPRSPRECSCSGLSLLLVRFPRREAADLDSGPPGHVHGIHDVLVDPIRPGLDAQQLGGALVVARVT